MRKPNSIIVLLFFHIIHPQKQKRSVQPFCFWGEHFKGLSNAGRRWTWHDKCNICSRYCIYHVKFTSYCELIGCSRPIRFFMVSLMYNKNNYWMRLSMISWIIKTEVCVICRSRRLRQITQTRGFIIHFSHNSSSETEAKRSAILFLRRTLEGA